MKWVLLSFSLFLWGAFAHSIEIKYEELPRLVEANNGKVLAQADQTTGAKKLTGSFTRSFVPELKIFAGTEHFDSKGLGTHPTDFYGVTTTVNIFNGMRDFWEEKRRKENVKLSEVEALSTSKNMIFEARKAYLIMYKSQKLKEIFEESLSRISQIEQKVRGKIKGGVISRSDLTTLSLIKLGLRESLRSFVRDYEIAHGKLRNLLGINESVEVIQSDVFLDNFSSQISPPSESTSLASKRYKAQAEVYEKASRVQANAIIPSVDLYASYQRQPYSQREILITENRNELRAGIVASWSLGEAFEKQYQARSLDWNAKAAKRLSEYHQSEFINQVQALRSQQVLFIESIEEINKEFQAGKNYYGQISSEYLRGVKSTSDLTSTFSQILELHQRKLELSINYKLAEAEIEALKGEN